MRMQWKTLTKRRITRISKMKLTVAAFHRAASSLLTSHEFSITHRGREESVLPHRCLSDMFEPPKSRQLQYYKPLQGHPRKTILKRNLPRQLFGQQIHLCPGQMSDCILNYGLWPWLNQIIGSWKVSSSNLAMKENQGKGMHIVWSLTEPKYPCKNMFRMKTFIFYECPLRMTSSERDMSVLIHGNLSLSFHFPLCLWPMKSRTCW